jgi:hypothetical protein
MRYVRDKTNVDGFMYVTVWDIQANLESAHQGVRCRNPSWSKYLFDVVLTEMFASLSVINCFLLIFLIRLFFRFQS